ncbi:MAG: hypothetical protein AB7F19_03420 [Candidatus Babeliales bacterium]
MYFISRHSKLTEFGLKLSAAMRWLLTCALLLLLGLMWYVAVFRGLHERLCKVQEDYQVLCSEQRVLATQKDKAAKLEALVIAQKTAWNTTAQHMQEQAGRDNLFALIDMFGKHGITIEAYHPYGTVEHSWYTKHSANIQFMATWEQLLALCTALQRDTTPYRVQQMHLERRDTTKIFGTMTLSQKVPKEIV